MAFYQKIAAHTLYQIIARVVSSGASFLITVLIARHFGVSAYGDYAKVTAFVTLFYLLADLGLNTIFLQKENATERFRDLFYTRLVWAAILCIVINCIALLLPYDVQTGIGFSPFVRVAIALFSITIVTESILYSAFVVFQRKYMYERFMVATVVGSVMTLVLVGVFVAVKLPFLWIFLAYVLGAVVEAAIAFYFTEEKVFPLRVHIQFIKSLLYETAPVALMLIFNLLYFRIDTFILALYRPSLDVGLYDVSYRVFDFLIALPLFLSNVLYPKLLADEKNNRNVKAKVMLYVGSFVGLGILFAVPFWIGSPLLFSLIKPQLVPAVVPLRILLVSLPIFFATNILQWLLLAKKQQVFLSIVYGILTSANILLNVAFIPHFGYVASAIITDGGELLVFLLLMGKVLQAV